MAKFKYLRGGRVFESDKVYNLPSFDNGGKLLFPKVKVAASTTAVANNAATNFKLKQDKYKAGRKLEDILGDAIVKKDKSRQLRNELSTDSTYGIGGTLKVGAAYGSKSINTAAKPKRDYGSILSSSAPFLDNFANLAATAATPKIPNPILTAGPRLATKLNINPQLRRIENDATSTNQSIDMGTSSAGVANANKGAVLANKLRAVGDLESNKQNFEAYQGNQAAMADYQARGMNNQLLNERNFNQMMRTDDVNQRYASVVSDFGSDIANIHREKNAMQLDREAMQMLSKINPDSAYQFADTPTFKTLYKNDEPGLRNLILKQKGTVPKSKLIGLYKELFNREFTQ